MIWCVVFKGPKAIPVYRAGLEEPHDIQAGAVAVQFLPYHYSFRWTYALLRENLKHPMDGWARLLWLCKIPLPVSETREWGKSCTYPFSLKEITSKLLWGDSFWVWVFKISLRNYFDEIQRKVASTCGKFVIDSKNTFAIALDFLQLFNSADTVLNALIYWGPTC